MAEHHSCIHCHAELVQVEHTWLCPTCNSAELKDHAAFTKEGEKSAPESDDCVFIDCPGATLYDTASNSVIRGVKFNDENDPFKGYRIIGEPVYATDHTRRRRIKRQALGRIRRCQACQDLTIRMRRPEGPDFCIPSAKFPHRKKLRSVSMRSTE